MNLLLYDGTNTLNLADGVRFGVPHDEWTPNVARLRTDALGGRGPYEAVDENIPLHARGVTGAEALANVQALARMMDQAARWWRGDNVPAVQLWYTPTGSTLGGYLKNAIVPSGRGGLVGLSPRINDAGNYEIPGLSLDVLRVEGQWLFDAYDVENYCLNSSFELFNGGSFPNWQNADTSTQTQVAALTHGRFAARLDGTTGDGGLYQDIAFSNGTLVTVSVRIKVISGLGNFRLQVCDHGSFTNRVEANTSATTTTAVSVTRAASGGGIRVYLHVATGMVAEVDAVMVEEGEGTDYHPNSDEVFVATVQRSGNPAVLTADWGVSGVESDAAPVGLRISTIETASGVNFDAGALVFRSGIGGTIQIEDSINFLLSAPSGGTFGVLADVTAHNGSVAALTPGTVGDYQARTFFLPFRGNRFVVYALVNQAASGAVGYAMTASLYQFKTVGESRAITVDAGQFDGNPFFVSFELIADLQSTPGNAEIRLTLTPDGTSATTLSIDYLVLVGVDDFGGVMVLDGFPSTVGFTEYTLDVDSGALTHMRPKMACTVDGGGFELNQPYRGNAWISQKGLTLDVLPLLKQGANWLYRDGGGSIMDFELTATRKLGFLTPE